MEIKLDNFLRADSLDGATSKKPKEAKIVTVRFIEAGDLPFESEVGKYELKIQLGDNEYDWLANNTSLKVLVTAFGKESDNWVGKTIKLYSVEQNVSGTIRQVVYATA